MYDNHSRSLFSEISDFLRVFQFESAGINWLQPQWTRWRKVYFAGNQHCIPTQVCDLFLNFSKYSGKIESTVKISPVVNSANR